MMHIRAIEIEKETVKVSFLVNNYNDKNPLTLNVKYLVENGVHKTEKIMYESGGSPSEILTKEMKIIIDKIIDGL